MHGPMMMKDIQKIYQWKKNVLILVERILKNLSNINYSIVFFVPAEKINFYTYFMTPKLSIGLVVFNGENFIINAITALLSDFSWFWINNFMITHNKLFLGVVIENLGNKNEQI